MTEKELIRCIEKRATPGQFQDGTPCRRLGAGAVDALSEAHGISGRAVEIAALQADIVPERYIRNRKSFSNQDQITLLGAHVAVVGLGGLGGTVVEILAREGIGQLTLVDGDRFDESNLNRQFLSTRELMATPKATAAARRVAAVNPSLAASAHSVFLTPENGEDLLRGADLVVDCLDNLKTRFELESVARSLGIPLVSAAIAGQSGHVTTVFPEDQGLSLIYGDPEDVDAKGAETTLGTLSHAITILSALECAEVVKVLLKKENSLRNQLLIMDLADYTFEVLALG